jgi:hypothetical protein
MRGEIMFRKTKFAAPTKALNALKRRERTANILKLSAAPLDVACVGFLGTGKPVTGIAMSAAGTALIDAIGRPALAKRLAKQTKDKDLRKNLESIADWGVIPKWHREFEKIFVNMGEFRASFLNVRKLDIAAKRAISKEGQRYAELYGLLRKEHDVLSALKCRVS